MTVVGLQLAVDVILDTENLITIGRIHECYFRYRKETYYI